MSITNVSQRESRRDFGVSHTTPTRPDPTRPLYLWLAFIHAVTWVTREARRARIDPLSLANLGDDMDAATRRRFA